MLLLIYHSLEEGVKFSKKGYGPEGGFMKFIFPQNYNFKSKLFGFIDYSTVFLNLVWGAIVFAIVFFLIPNITMKIGIFIILFLPFALFSIIGFNHEKTLYILMYLYKYVSSPKLYLYSKKSSK